MNATIHHFPRRPRGRDSKGRLVTPPEHEAVIEGDRRFFERHRHRSYRMRLTSQAELDMAGRVGARVASPEKGHRWVTIVRQIAPGFRKRLMCQLPEDASFDAPEQMCVDLFDYLDGGPETRAAGFFVSRRRSGILSDGRGVPHR
jgi:hypothetical protein